MDGKGLYVIKMWLFRKQLNLTKAEQIGIRDVAAFAVVLYLKAWMTASVALQAPLKDFLLMKSLQNYPVQKISTATSKKLGLHLWYLSEELVTMALFDSRVTPETKRKMLTAMNRNTAACPSLKASKDE